MARVDRNCMDAVHERCEGMDCACSCHTASGYRDLFGKRDAGLMSADGDPEGAGDPARPTDMFGNDLTRTDSFGTSRGRTVSSCQLCGELKHTPQVGSRLCDRCWELKWRIEADPDLARRILAGVDPC